MEKLAQHEKLASFRVINSFSRSYPDYHVHSLTVDARQRPDLVADGVTVVLGSSVCS